MLLLAGCSMHLASAACSSQQDSPVQYSQFLGWEQPAGSAVHRGFLHFIGNISMALLVAAEVGAIFQTLKLSEQHFGCKVSLEGWEVVLLALSGSFQDVKSELSHVDGRKGFWRG